MAFNKLKQIVKNVVICATALGVLTGCPMYFRSYKAMPSYLVSSIKPVSITEENIKNASEDDFYDRMTWQEAIAYVKTPEQVNDYFRRHFKVDSEESKKFFGFHPYVKGETFRHNHTRKKGVCLDYATVAAALLSDDGYPPLLLVMEDKESAHAVFLYRAETGFGCLGLGWQSPKHKTIDDLVDVTGCGKYDHYCIVNLDENFKNREWIDGDINMQISWVNRLTKVKR